MRSRKVGCSRYNLHSETLCFSSVLGATRPTPVFHVDLGPVPSIGTSSSGSGILISFARPVRWFDALQTAHPSPGLRIQCMARGGIHATRWWGCDRGFHRHSLPSSYYCWQTSLRSALGTELPAEPKLGTKKIATSMIRGPPLGFPNDLRPHSHKVSPVPFVPNCSSPAPSSLPSLRKRLAGWDPTCAPPLSTHTRLGGIVCFGEFASLNVGSPILSLVLSKYLSLPHHPTRNHAINFSLVVLWLGEMDRSSGRFTGVDWDIGCWVEHDRTAMALGALLTLLYWR